MNKQMLSIVCTLLAILFYVEARSFYYRNNDVDSYDEEQQNSLSPIGTEGSTKKSPSDLMKHFVKISYSTEGILRVKQGEPIELECVAVGSYSPSLDWYKGEIPITNGEDNNYISKFDVTKTVIRYIEDCAQPKHEGTYTCNALTGTVSATSPSVTVLVSDKMNPRLLTNGGECRYDQRLPRINRYTPVVMQNIGTDVKLTCRTQGTPRPYVYWTDKKGHILDTSAGSRFRIHDSGDLLIRNLRWPDMGVYLCVAESGLGKDVTSTFLYPMLEEEKES